MDATKPRTLGLSGHVEIVKVEFVFFVPIGRPLIGCDIFDFSSETTERN